MPSWSSHSQQREAATELLCNGGKQCDVPGIEVKGARSAIPDRLESLPTALPLLNDHRPFNT